MTAPRINEEIWGDLTKLKRVQTTDKSLRDIQNLVCSGMLPILSLAKMLKSQISSMPHVKDLIADSITIFGQVQFLLSVRRRYLLRPSFKAKYSNICGISTPITSQLFGDDISKELKKCETSIKVGKCTYNPGFYRPSRGQSNYGPSRSWGGRGRSSRIRGYPYNRPAERLQQYGQFGHQHSILPRATKKNTPPAATPSNPN